MKLKVEMHQQGSVDQIERVQGRTSGKMVIIVGDKLFLSYIHWQARPRTIMMASFFQSQTYLEGDVQMDKIVILSHIGRGNSDVYLASIGPKNVAIKQTQIQSDYQYHNFLKEISMLKCLSESSTNIIHYEGYFLTLPNQPAYSTNKYGYLVMEKAQMNLAELVKSYSFRKNRLSSAQLNGIVSSLLTGFSYLQNLNIAHCDIKPENVLVTNYEDTIVKICDVGSCKTIQLDDQKEATIKGTLAFSAPQLIKIQADKITTLNAFRSDVFSFGLLLLYLVTNKKFTSKDRKETKEEVYSEVIGEWTQEAAQILQEDQQVAEIIKKALQIDQYKRPLFKQLKILYDSLNRKRKILKENKIRKIKRAETESDHTSNKKKEYVSERPILPKIKISNSSTLISFHSRQMLTSKITLKSSHTQLDKDSRSKSKKSNDKPKSKNSQLQKTTNYSTFSIDKSKISMQSLSKKIIHVTAENHHLIPYENLFQEESTFVLHCPFIQFEAAFAVVVKRSCGIEIFNKLSKLKSASNLYLEYQNAHIQGSDQNTPTVSNFTSVFINLENSSLQCGYNNLLRCLCPIALKDLHLQLTGSQISYKQVRMEIERLKSKKYLTKLDMSWDHAFINAQQFAQLNQSISKLPLKKLILSLDSAFLKPSEKSRWPLPSTCKILYLNLPNNFLSSIVGNLSLSLASLSELKQLYLNLENNCLTDTDVKILIKTLTGLDSLEKAVLNFAWNPLMNGCYCFEQLSQLSKIASLQLRISKCGLTMQQFLQVFGTLIKLFNSDLKILKISYERKVGKNKLLTALQDKMVQEYADALMVDMVGYDYSHWMVYVKKKTQQSKNIRIRVKQNVSKNSMNKIGPGRNVESAAGNSNKTIPSSQMYMIGRKNQKEDDDENQPFTNIKQSNVHKQRQKTCPTLFSTYPTYECYICLGCIEDQQTAKTQYFCRACIESCHHKGHHIVRTYEKKLCACPYNHKCLFKEENNDLICADKIGIQYKKQYECQKCHLNESSCEGCILQCQEDHPELVLKKSSGFFQCHTHAKQVKLQQEMSQN